MIDYREHRPDTMTWEEFQAQEATNKAMYATETDWQLMNVEGLQRTEEEKQAIGLEKSACTFCDRNNYFWPLFKGTATGIIRPKQVKCPCVVYKRFYPEFCRNVHAHDRGISLKTLAPSPKSRLSHDYQEKIITHLQEHATDSYAFFGPAGYSKTTYSIALYRENLWNAARRGEHFCVSGGANSVTRISAKALLDQFVAAATGTATKGNVVVQPALNARKTNQIVSSGRVPRLFLEEVDKVSYTEFKINCLFEVIDSLYQHQGQLVFDTNLPLEELSSLFVGATGEALMRRLSEMCRVYNFF